jgi:hypothetical protein
VSEREIGLYYCTAVARYDAMYFENLKFSEISISVNVEYP